MPKKKNALIPNAALRLTILSMLFYTATYLCRKSFDSNINELMDFYGQGKASIGLIGTFFFAAYAIGQVFHGIFCKFYPPRIFLFGMGVAVAVMSFLMGRIPPEQFGLLKFIWLLNGFVCASFWSLFILTLNRCVAKEHMPLVMLISCFPVSVGTFLSYGISALFSYLNCFKASFYVSAIVMTVIAVCWLSRSEALMNASLEEKREKDGIIPSDDQAKPKSTPMFSGWTKSFVGVFVILAIFAIVDNFVRDGLNTWTPSILKETYQMENWLSVLLSVSVPLISVLGGVLSIFFYRHNKNCVFLSGILFFAAAVILCPLLFFTKIKSWVIILLCLILASLMMSAVNNILTSIFPLNVGEMMNAGMVAGLLDGFCYVGSAISSYGLGSLAEAKGEWTGVFVLMISLVAGCGVIAIASIPFLAHKRKDAPADTSLSE